MRPLPVIKAYWQEVIGIEEDAEFLAVEVVEVSA